MDIIQLKYFIAIVENDLNLSLASKKLHLSQPALSKYILKFEEEENLKLFERKNGRLSGLTFAGENFYNNAKVVVESHTNMLSDLREQSKQITGSVTIGIPPLILTVLFTEIMAQLITSNPTINFIILELGAFELKKLLLLGEIDFAVILSPSEISPLLFEETMISEDELTLFMSVNNPLSEKKSVEWADLKKIDLAIFNETFMIHHQLKRKFDALKIYPKISLMSGSWDFLLEVTRTSNFVTILPSPIHWHFNYDDVAEVPIEDPISWKVILTHPIKTHYSRLELYTKESIINYFVYKNKIIPMDEWESLKPAEK
jgi:DNA-binding transcriptional LysR family regulator